MTDDPDDVPEWMCGFGPKVEPKPKREKPKKQTRRRVLWIRPDR